MGKEKNWCIYCHTNKINGKKYIGYTVYSDDLEKRWHNGNGYKKHPLFYNAIKKYGWENFTHTIIESNITEHKTICEREKYWIAYYHTFNGDPECNGYNMTIGGDGIYPGFKHSDETKAKIGKASTGRIKSDETCKKLSEAKLGHTTSEETKKKISLAHIGQHYPPRSIESRNRSSNAHPNKPILCIETGIIYNKTKEAAKLTGISRSAICNCINGFSKTAGGFHWEFVDKNNKYAKNN